MKARHKGTCQACGAVHKLPKGQLSNHGYKVQWNMFLGTCQGSGRLPYEKSCDYIKECISHAKNQIERINKEISKLNENQSNNSEFHLYKGNKEGYSWVKCEVKEKMIVLEDETKVNPLRYSLYGTDLEIAKKLDDKKVLWLNKQIKQIESYISWQEERIDNWKEQDLIEI